MTKSEQQKKELSKLFVPKDIATAIHIYGFNKPCLAYYGNDEELKYTEWGTPLLNEDFRTTSTAPVWQQVVDFLEEDFKIVVKAEKEFDGGSFLGWAPIVETEEDFIEMANTKDKLTALEAAIWKAIDIIGKRKNAKTESAAETKTE